ncbi:PREDICTED: uncharacterized protein LOC104597417 isoform X2 [Nelumbo nucifera]|uniref:Uncharacterized protein LOC104597417 isoform X2 n=1 Tax=Nelumbo nucifera TaxID=4432 RepID=A0A1U8A719_NELNU|nr:PREDICTED: uncharacterized protein LOC104597417 isoform X2 [Nelumbo nucifera]
MACTEEPILSRLDRLDNVLRHLEEIRGCNRCSKSSYESATSSGPLTSDGGNSSVDFSPKSLEKHCRPIEHVMMETEAKGSLIERMDHVEDRLLKLEVAKEKEKEDEKSEKKPHKKGLKQLVKSCVKRKPKTKH